MKTRHNIPFKRKKEGKTNYKKRLKILMSNKLRLVIRKSLNNMITQIIEYNAKGDRVILSAHSNELNKFGWNVNKGNTPAAYLTGLLLGIKAKKKNIKDLVLDIGLQKSIKGSRIYAALKGVVDSGLNVSYSKDIIPDENRIKGVHISKYAANLKGNEKFFGNYLKNKVDPTQIGKLFEEIKNKIKGAENNG